MRYRLRTLLIVLTVACIYSAWAGYCRRMGMFHRQQSSQIILQYSIRSGWTRERLENHVSDLFARFPEKAAQMGNPEFVRGGGWNPVYASAAAHEGMARKYDRAILYPWVLISK